MDKVKLADHNNIHVLIKLMNTLFKINNMVINLYKNLNCVVIN